MIFPMFIFLVVLLLFVIGLLIYLIRLVRNPPIIRVGRTCNHKVFGSLPSIYFTLSDGRRVRVGITISGVVGGNDLRTPPFRGDYELEELGEEE
ncbi:hypothetical protein MK805_11530 [Shimazuella sp. AN120528]|uniref:hypothetical protein n=1 Tax=Shimazuella soli TaxID=1892854 RepID=UPI001F0F2F7E|nr:hypothetical protein [Shimazuella soli]MCH5585576.1 hypothetical protein [Shimazuella soli]